MGDTADLRHLVESAHFSADTNLLFEVLSYLMAENSWCQEAESCPGRLFQALGASGFTLPTHVSAPVAASGSSALRAVEPGRRERAAAFSVAFKGCDCCCYLHRNGLSVAVSTDEGAGERGTNPPDFYVCFISAFNLKQLY